LPTRGGEVIVRAGDPIAVADGLRTRVAMKLVDRLGALYDEANEIMLKIDPTTLPYITGSIIGTGFRELLAAIWGRDMKIDGMPLLPPRD
jgi:hypothetical protein